jgi:hypothetical protein
MANTEGMSDEVIESLLGNPSATTTMGPPVRANTAKERAARQRRLQERMELPMGGNPAAKIIRASPKSLSSRLSSTTTNTTSHGDEDYENETDRAALSSPESSTTASAQSIPTPLVGSIMERPMMERISTTTNKVTFAGTNNPKMSRFAQQQQQANKPTALNINGFPSVHVPLGTFVSKKNKTDPKYQQPTHHASQPAASTATRTTTAMPKSSPRQNDNSLPIALSSSTDAVASSLSRSNQPLTIRPLFSKKAKEDEELSKMRDSTQQQAQAMLTQMSTLEIQESIQELETSLKPEMLAFLKRRGAVKNNQQQQQQQHQPPPRQQHPQSKKTATSKAPTEMPRAATPKDSIQEKERIAKLVASVKTHQDLDALYKAELQQQHFLEKNDDINDTNQENGQEDENCKKSLDLAYTLLRSTVPRQASWAARAISLHLRERYMAHIHDLGTGTAGLGGRRPPHQQDWPSILPVSLRCLLDQPPHQSNSGYLLHTYVLQSLYYLLCLGAHSDHVVAMDDKYHASLSSSSLSIWTPATCFQTCFMDDSVPTPRLGDCYPAAQAPQPLTTTTTTTASGENDKAHYTNTKTGETMAYSTSSSSSSAEQDGEAFAKDPMWTLLSRMRIVPRIAQLLDWSSSSSSSSSQQDSSTCGRLPREALVAVCGIFAMISQRSPGAASAIVHHSTLLPQLLDRTLLQLVRLHQDDTIDDTVDEKEAVQVALPAVVLLCTLARQSRVTAEKVTPLVVDDVLPAILSKQPSSNKGEMGVLQDWLLILWRTLLRYGLGLSNLSTMITLSVRHLTLSHVPRDETGTDLETGGTCNLTTGFLSALAQVLECVHFARSKSHALTRNMISPEIVQVMSLASTWLSSSRRLVLSHLVSTSLSASTLTEPEKVQEEALLFRTNAAELRFLSSFWNLFLDHQEADSNAEIKVGDVSREEEQVCLQALLGWMASGGVVERAWKAVSKYCGEADFDMVPMSTSTSIESHYCLEREAAACALLESIVSLLVTLEKTRMGALPVDGDSCQAQDSAKIVVTRFLTLLLDGIQEATSMTANHAERDGKLQRRSLSLAQRGWINQCHFGVSKFFFHCMSLGILVSSSDIGLVRLLVFSLLGRLERGSEAMAAVLFSQDRLFQGNMNSVLQEDDTSPYAASPVSSMLLGELCGSDSARTQLDHSFKLHHGFGITSDGFGSFKLESLLSDSDQGPKRESPSSTEMTLPVGKIWLWQTLSGAVQMKDQTVATGTKEAASVVSSCLDLLLDLEEDADLLANESRAGTGNYFSYTAQIPLGARLYYVINVCLHPEAVLREDNVNDPAEAVLNRYLPRLDGESAHHFAMACLEHTEPNKKQHTGASALHKEVNEELDDKEKLEKKLASMFLPEESATTGSGGDIIWSSQEMKAVEALLEDLLSAYTDYGAQYNFFTKCMRLFLLPVFPSSLRCRVLNELRGMIHLLTLPDEIEEPEAKDMRLLLEQCISDGLAPRDSVESTRSRDPADLLDAVASILDCGGDASQRPLQGYVLLYSISLLVRSIAINCLDAPGSAMSSTLVAAREATKKRLLRMDGAVAKLLLDAAASLLATQLTKEALVKVVIRLEMPYSIALAASTGGKMDEKEVERGLHDLEGLCGTRPRN